MLGHLLCHWTTDPIPVLTAWSGLTMALGLVAFGGILDQVTRRLGHHLPPLTGIGITLALASARDLWGQAVIIEVYALQFAILAWAWLAALGATESGGAGRRLIRWAVLAGLAVAAHPTSVLWLPGMALLLAMGRRPRYRRRHLLAAALVLFAVPLFWFALLPLLAQGNPPVNWHAIDGPRAWWDLVTAAQYRDRFEPPTIAGFGRWWAFQVPPLLDRQWPGLAPPVMGAAMLTLLVALGRAWRSGWWLLLLAIALPPSLQLASYRIPDWTSHALPWLALAVLPVGLVLAKAAGAATHAPGTPRRLARWAGTALALLFWIIPASRHLPEIIGPFPDLPERFARRTWAQLWGSSLVITDSDGRDNALLVARWLWHPERTDVAVVWRSMLAHGWYRRHLRGLHPWLNWPPDAVAAGSGAGNFDQRCDAVARSLILGQPNSITSYVALPTPAIPDGWVQEIADGLIRLRRPDANGIPTPPVIPPTLPHPDDRLDPGLVASGAGSPATSEAVRVVPLDLRQVANADYRANPLIAGTFSNDPPLYPHLAGGHWPLPETAGFWLLPPTDGKPPGNCVTNCGGHPEVFDLPLPSPPPRAREIQLLVVGGFVRDAGSAPALLAVTYEDQTGSAFLLDGIPDYLDTDRFYPPAVRVPLDERRRLKTLRIRSRAIRGTAGVIAGISVLAASLVVPAT